MWVSCTAARSWVRETPVICAFAAHEGATDEWGSEGTDARMDKWVQILVKETCSLLTVKLRLGWVGAAVLLEAATLDDAEGALGRFEEPGLRGEEVVVVGGGGGDVSGGAPALGTPPTRSM